MPHPNFHIPPADRGLHAAKSSWKAGDSGESMAAAFSRSRSRLDPSSRFRLEVAADALVVAPT